MPIGKDKKSVQAYVKTDTKNKIAKIAKEKQKSESSIAGEILDQAFTPVNANK